MLVRRGVEIISGLFDAIVRPSRFVQVQTSTYSTTRLSILMQILRLTVVWGVNLLLYAVPLTLAGIGFTSDETAPKAFATAVSPFIGSADAAWQLTVGFVQNSVFLTVATGIAFISFHGSIVIVKQSRGVIQSLHTVVYTTSAYLAGIFTIVMYLSTTQGLSQAREIVRTLQAKFIYGIIDLMGVNLVVPGVEPGSITVDGISETGSLLLALLVLLSMYFLYSMYLGARMNHQLNRLDSSIVVLGVLFSPAAYIAGSTLLSLFMTGQGM